MGLKREYPHFRDWLETQRHREDPVGDLARDAHQDAEFPATHLAAARYIEVIGSEAAHTAALRSVAEYQAWKRTVERLEGFR